MAVNPIKTVADATSVTALLTAQTTNTTSSVIEVGSRPATFQSFISGTGAVAGTVKFYGNNSNAASNGVLLATHTLSGTTSDVAGSVNLAAWPFIYAVLSGISGTSAAVTVTVSV